MCMERERSTRKWDCISGTRRIEGFDWIARMAGRNKAVWIDDVYLAFSRDLLVCLIMPCLLRLWESISNVWTELLVERKA